MLTSKNFLWLGFFSTLLFLTFCVTFNLDKLNPNIVNITPEELDKRELNNDKNMTHVSKKSDEGNSPQFTIIKISSRDTKHINVIDKFNTDFFIKQQNKKIETKTTPPIQEEIKEVEAEEDKYKKIIENKNFIFHKRLTTKQKQILNRLAYKTNLDENSAIFIKTSDSESEVKISSYLQQIGVEKEKIKIDQSSDKNKKVNLSLRKRS